MTKESLKILLEPFDDDIQLVDQNNRSLFAYYIVDEKGNGKIVIVNHEK